MKLDRPKYIESRSVKPLYVLFTLIGLNIILGLIAFVFPEEGVMISKNLGLKFPSRNEVYSINPKETIVVDVDSILQDIEPIVEETEGIDTVSKDLMARLDEALAKTFVFDSSTGRWEVSVRERIHNAPALITFIKALLFESADDVVRVVHYGDSQLEGDRISDYLRNRLQSIFGGMGPGFVQPMEPTAGSRHTAYVTHSPNMKKHAVYVQGSDPPHGYYGLGGASFEVQGFYKKVVGYDTSYVSKIKEEDSTSFVDTVIKALFETINKTTAYIQVNNAKSSYQRVRSYERIRLLYSADEPFGISFSADSNRIDEILPAGRYVVKEWLYPTKSKVRLDILQGKYPLIFGMALDGKSGVAVDNFPMRGSSDIGFTRADSSIFGGQLRDMNVKLVILQYGVNVIPYVVSDYSYYKRRLVKEINAVKKAVPGVSVLVIGPSDMSRNKGGAYISYPNIPAVRKAMFEAAVETNSAFWDLYTAMGGENSMVAWVDKNYAAKDYTHFSSKGAKYVGEMLFEAILEEVLKFQESDRSNDAGDSTTNVTPKAVTVTPLAKK